MAPFLVAFIGILVERVLIRRLYGRDPLYSLLLTFGLAFMIEDGTRFIWGAQSLPFSDSGLAVEPAQQRILLPHRLPRVHDAAGDGGGRRRCS